MARDFDGSADYLENTSPSGVPLDVPLSIGFFIFPDTFSATMVTFSFGPLGNPPARGFKVVVLTSGVVRVTKWSVGTQDSTTTLAATGEWYFVGCSFRSDDTIRVHIYRYSTATWVHENMSGTLNMIANNSGDNMRIASDQHTAFQQFWDGRIGWVSLYDSDLGDTDFENILSRAWLPGNNPDLAVPIGFGSPDPDYSGNGNAFTLVSAPPVGDGPPVGLPFGFDDTFVTAAAAVDISHVAALADSFDNAVQRRPIKVTSF